MPTVLRVMRVAESCAIFVALLTYSLMAVAGTCKEAPSSIDSSPGSVPVSPVKLVARSQSLAKCK